MRKISHSIAIIGAICLFVVPFFWLKQGNVDLGGDAGRLYFMDPWAVAYNAFMKQNIAGVSMYASVLYELYLSGIQLLLRSPTLLIAFEQGIKLAVGFFSIYLIVFQIITVGRIKDFRAIFVSIVSGIVYVSLLTKTGWGTSLETHNQVFLNPLIFYFLLQFSLSRKVRYIALSLVLTLVYSANFSYSAAPQLFSFYPLAIAFMFLIVRFVFKKKIPLWELFWASVAFLGLHAFHIVPVIASIVDKNTAMNSYIFSETTKLTAGLNYFDANRQDLGKLSWELFQPARWNGQTVFILLLPLIAFVGFLKKPSKMLGITGVFFALTYFLVSANITIVGIKIYRLLFSIPGFMMFRSFDEKWYYIYSFFYTLLFGFSLYLVIQKQKRLFVWLISAVVLISVLVRIVPFMQGDFYNKPLHQSSNVSSVFRIDSDLKDVLTFVKNMPDDGSFLTLPLTLPYFQVIHGAESGAYVGISMVHFVGGKKDYAGFLSFGPHSKTIVELLQSSNSEQVPQLLSLLNVRYVFRNTDTRVMDLFPKYPFYKYDMTVDIPMIDSQDSYNQLLDKFPIQTIYTKGFFEILQLSDDVVRPTIYIPDIIYASKSGVLNGASFRSAYLENGLCDEGLATSAICDKQEEPTRIAYKRISSTTYEVDIDNNNSVKPFVVILSEDYHPSWRLALSGVPAANEIQHIRVNGYGNGWIIYPSNFQSKGHIQGTIHLGFQKYFMLGWTLSILACIFSVGFGIWHYKKKRHEN